MSFRDKVDQLNVWSHGGERAPHKPLLLLLILARKSRALPDEVTFTEIEDTVRDLLFEFGPSRKSYHPEYPFWRLQNDGIWEVASDVPMSRERRAGGGAEGTKAPRSGSRGVLAWGAGGRPDRNQTITARFFGLLAWV